MQTPDDVRDKRFLIALRGYDRDEVEAYLDQLATQLADLQAQLASATAARDEALAAAAAAPAAPAAPASDESSSETVVAEPAPTAALPTDRVALLQTLGAETTRILTVAEESAASIRKTAEDEVAALRQNAATETTELRETTEAEVAALREESEKEAAAVIEAAKAEARAEAEQANRQAARLISEAERRRDKISAEVHGIQEHRTQLIQDLQGAVNTITSTVSDLEQGSRDAGASGESDEEPAPAAAAAAPVAPPETVAAEPEAEPEPEPDAEPSGPGDAVQPESETPAAPAATSEPDVEVTAATTSESEVPAEAQPEFVTQPESVPDIATDEPGPVEPEADEPEADEPEADEPEPTVVDDGPTSDEPADDEPDTREPQAAADADAPDAATAEAAATDEVDEAGVLQELAVALVRELKRGLSTMQSGVLEAIRTTKDPSIEDLLPSQPALDELGSLAGSHLGDAYSVAIVDASEDVDGDVPTALDDGARVPAATATFRAVLAHEITSALRPSLRAGLEADESQTSLSERVGEVFRDLKGPVLESLAEQHLSRTYGNGQVDAWQELGVEAVTWVLGEESRCPEGRCRGNADASPVGLGEDFPSGDRVPPAHPGCTCTLSAT